VTAADVARFFSGRLEKSALQLFLEQALSPCPQCRERLCFYAPDRSDAGLERHVALWAEEQAGLARLRAKGGSEPFDGSYSRFKHVARRVPGWARIEHLIELSREMRYRDPEQMWILAQGAASAAINLGVVPIDKDRYTPAQKTDLRARTKIELANALRLIHNYAHAEDCLAEAAEMVREGSCAPETKGRLMDIYASLLMDQRQLDEAFALLDKLHHHYLNYGESHLAGRALFKKGLALHRDDRPQEAVSALRKGLASLTPERDPKLFASGQHTLVLALVEARSFSEAGELLMQSGLRHAFADDPLNLLKLRWVEGKIFAGLGKLKRAENIFTEVKAEFLQRDRKYLVAMMDLELTGVLLRQGRAAEVDALAEEALVTFRELKIDREALKAVRYLREACRLKLATAGMVQEVVRFLNRLEQRPGLRFQL